MSVVFIAVIFLVIFSLMMLCAALVFAQEKTQQRKQFTQMLRTVQAGTRKPVEELLRPADDKGMAGAWLADLPLAASLQNSLRQAGTTWSAAQFVGICFAGAIAGCMLGAKVNLLSLTTASMVVFGLAGAVAPIAVLARKKSKNIKAFEDQLPEALDFLTRCLQAGHGFTTGLQMLAAEAPEPLGSAIRRVSNELQLGSGLDVALGSLTETVPLVDVRFFISAVVVQRETGGNLGEILGRLSELIRARVKLRGKIGALSAHGRITGLVLLMMPVAVLLILSVMSPEYVAGLTKDATGQKLLAGAALGQVLAWFCIRKIVDIRV